MALLNRDNRERGRYNAIIVNIIIVIIRCVAPAIIKSAREGREGDRKECDDIAGTLINYSPLLWAEPINRKKLKLKK